MKPRGVRRNGRPDRGGAHIALLVLIGATVLWLIVLTRIYFNASWSDDAWGYFVLPLTGDPKMGERVLFDPPETVNAPFPYVKTVRGLPGAVVAVSPEGTVRVGGAALGRAKARALDGRPLKAIAPGTVPADHYYVHAAHPDSHDSRYAEVGLIPRSRIRGRAYALPVIPWLGLDGPLAPPEVVVKDADTTTGTAKPPRKADIRRDTAWEETR